MTLKTASLFALVGMILVTVLQVLNFTFNILNVIRGLAPAMIVLSSLIYALAALCITVFFFVFHTKQS
jgi:hypothetical protein